MKNLAFHQLIQMKDDYTTNSHLYVSLLKVWENVLFELGSEKIKTTSGKGLRRRVWLNVRARIPTKNAY